MTNEWVAPRALGKVGTEVWATRLKYISVNLERYTHQGINGSHIGITLSKLSHSIEMPHFLLLVGPEFPHFVMILLIFFSFINKFLQKIMFGSSQPYDR